MGLTLSLPTPDDIATNGEWGDDINAAINDLNSDQFKIKTADGTGATSNTTLADDNQLINIALGVGTWEIDVVLFCTGAAAADVKVAWGFSGTTTTAVRGGHGPSAAVTSALTGAGAGQRTAGASDTGLTITTGSIYATDGTNHTMIIEKGVLVVTVAGNFKIQMAQGTSTASAVLLKAGSYVKARKVAS